MSRPGGQRPLRPVQSPLVSHRKSTRQSPEVCAGQARKGPTEATALL